MPTDLTAGSLYAFALRTAHDRVGDQADVEAEDAINLALEMLAKARRWPWYYEQRAIAFVAPVTLSVTLTQGDATVTTSGTWPTWAASGSLEAEGHVLDIVTRTSATEVEIEIEWPYETQTITTTVFQDQYTLDTDLIALDRLYPGEKWIWGGSPVSLEDFWALRSSATIKLTRPTAWAVQKNTLRVYPYASEASLSRLAYYRVPTKPTSGTDTVDWDPNAMEPLLRAIEFQITTRYLDEERAAVAYAYFDGAVRRNIPFDRGVSDLPSIGEGYSMARHAVRRPSIYQRG